MTPLCFYADDVAARRKFILIALVLFVLIFNMPSGLVLYWLALNICAMSRLRLMRLYMLREINICENAVSGAVIWLKGGHFYTVI